MSYFKLLRFCVVVAMFVCATFSFSQNAGKNPGSVDKFIANLPGYTIFEGSAFQIDTARMCCETKLPTALFFNKAPYVAFSVKDVQSHLDQFQDLPIFQLGVDEAIVVIGVTPPEAKFFNYLPFLLARYFPPDTVPKPIFATLGDSVNLSTIKTIGPDPFNRPMVLIFTPDQGTDARIRTALHNAGYPDAIINTLAFPAPMLKLGVDLPGFMTHDLFIIVSRMGVWSDPIAGQAYIDELRNKDMTKRPLRVFRVTPPSGGALKPFSTPPLRIRGTGRSEMDLTPTMARLRQAIIEYWDARGFNATEYHSKVTAYEGYDYIQRVKNVLGDNRDALYLEAGYQPLFDLEDKLTLGDSDFLVAYGPRHDLTGKATYTNVSVYASEKVMYNLGTVYNSRFGGSVQPYLANNQDLAKDPAADLLYAYKFARQCDDYFCEPLVAPPNCVPWCPEQEDKTKCPPFTFDPGTSTNTQLGLFFRIYLEPQTRVGAAFTEVLYDQVIKFSPK